jgi:hypothetical protein
MFKLMLMVFGLSMKTLYSMAAIMDKDFKNRLKERDIAIVIKTLDGKNARTYLLRGGRISSLGKDHHDPDLCIAWSSALDFYRTIVHISPKVMVKSFIGAFRDGKLKIECKVGPFVWFSQTLNQMLAVFCDRTKPKKFFIINAEKPS